MQLNVNDDRVLVSPSNEELEAAVRQLSVDEFLVLKKSDEVYIQTYHNEDGTFQLEYRNGGAEQHYGVDPESITEQDVCRAFQTFANDFSQLPSALNWSPLVLDEEEFEDGPEAGDEPMIEYQGVMMPESWCGQIKDAQEMSMVSMSGKELPRLRFGSETKRAAGANCGDCGVLVDQFHVPGCDGEQCPKCGGQLISCDCEIDED